MICPHCKKELTSEQVASLLGSIRTKKKSKASIANGQKGGRPIGSKDSSKRTKRQKDSDKK